MRKHSSISAQYECVVAFHDVDLAQVVWHGHYVRYLENARWVLMGRIGIDLDAMMQSGYLWPVVDLQVKYIRAARYGDPLIVRASLVDWQQRLAINYLVTDARDGARVARAQTVQVAVRPPENELQLSMPEWLTSRVERFLAATAGAAPTSPAVPA